MADATSALGAYGDHSSVRLAAAHPPPNPNENETVAPPFDLLASLRTPTRLSRLARADSGLLHLPDDVLRRIYRQVFAGEVVDFAEAPGRKGQTADPVEDVTTTMRSHCSHLLVCARLALLVGPLVVEEIRLTRDVPYYYGQANRLWKAIWKHNLLSSHRSSVKRIGFHLDSLGEMFDSPSRALQFSALRHLTVGSVDVDDLPFLHALPTVTSIYSTVDKRETVHLEAGTRHLLPRLDELVTAGGAGDYLPSLSDGRMLRRYYNVGLKRDALPWRSATSIELCLFAETDHDDVQFILDDLGHALVRHQSRTNFNRDVARLPHLRRVAIRGMLFLEDSRTDPQSRAAFDYLCSNVVAKLVENRVPVQSLELINADYLVPLPDSLPSTLRHLAISTWEQPFEVYQLPVLAHLLHPLPHFAHLQFASGCSNETALRAAVRALQWTTRVQVIEDIEAPGPRVESADIPDVISYSRMATTWRWTRTSGRIEKVTVEVEGWTLPPDGRY